MVLGRAREFRRSVTQRVGGQLVEGIAAEWRQITLRERAAKHTATEVLESTPPADARQSGWFNYKDDRLRPSKALASPSIRLCVAESPARRPSHPHQSGQRGSNCGTLLSSRLEGMKLLLREVGRVVKVANLDLRCDFVWIMFRPRRRSQLSVHSWIGWIRNQPMSRDTSFWEI